MTQTGALIKQLVKTDFKLRYNSSVLGYAWSLLKPLLIFTILNFVFSKIFGVENPNYSLRLLTSIILWTFFSEGTTTGLHSIMNKAGILTKIKLPLWIVVFSSTIHIVITFVLNLIILGLFFVLYSFVPTLEDFLFFTIYSFCIYIIILGFSLAAAPLYVKYRDLHQIWEVLLLGGFYAAPIIYPMQLIPTEFHWLLQINPMTFILQHVQAVLFVDDFKFSIVPNFIYFGVLLLGFLTCIVIYRKYSQTILEEL
ncbi:ABC transporter permease [Candidatus Dojkabacteria bacterium]|uniref:Transport permease protein n=1 Tax=Candidatus Dojkabacteria bacterium TaxID=2099670 RepID=A0A955RKC0_9BACT|nr:ABC transporter permease [Candidatus Dojkabacteria bacterium]